MWQVRSMTRRTTLPRDARVMESQENTTEESGHRNAAIHHERAFNAGIGQGASPRRPAVVKLHNK